MPTTLTWRMPHMSRRLTDGRLVAMASRPCIPECRHRQDAGETQGRDALATGEGVPCTPYEIEGRRFRRIAMPPLWAVGVDQRAGSGLISAKA
jgi:hypothetical protein